MSSAVLKIRNRDARRLWLYTQGLSRTPTGPVDVLSIVRGLGLMCAVEFVKDRNSKEEFPKEAGIGAKLNAAVQRRGLFSRVRGDVFVLAPPIPISHDDLKLSVEALVGAVDEVLG